MKFSIITPSFNQLSYLKRCVASVADQQGAEIEHIVIDGGSTDGTVEFLKGCQSKVEGRRSNEGANNQYPITNNYRFTWSSERDAGMYDALNKGISFALQKQSSGNRQRTTDSCDDEIVAWLNCDEQYLSGTLSFVQDWFAAHPQADLLSGSALLIRPDGSLLAFRKAYPLRRCYIAASHLYNLSCAMFFRRRVWERGVRFDSSYRNLGDQDWVMRLLQSGVRTGCTEHFLSAFCFTGQNMSQSPQAHQETAWLRAKSPRWTALCKRPLNGARLAEKALRGVYYQRAFDYAVYSDGHADRRGTVHVEKASFRWPDVREGTRV